MARAWGDPAAYAASFGPLCAETVDEVVASCGPPVAERFLDVGCGTGAVAEAAVRSGWSTVAVDADPAMVAAARHRLDDAVGLVVGALPQLPFADRTFAAVGANFVVNHTDDPRAAVVELGRVCRPGGRVAVTVWPERLIVVNRLWNDVMLAAGVEPPPRKGLPAERDFDRSRDGLAELVGVAGLCDVVAREVDVVLRVTPDALWRAAEGGVATIGAVHHGLAPRGRQRLRDAFDAITRDRTTDGSLVLPGTALLAYGQRRE